MPSDTLPFLFCFGFLFFLVPTVVCIVLAVRLTELRGRVGQLETRLAELTKEFLLRTRPAVSRPQEAAPAVHRPDPGAASVPQARPATPVQPAPHGTPIPLTPERHDWPGEERPARVVPPALPPQPAPAPVAAHGTSERLLGKMEELRQKEERKPAVPQVAASVPAPVAPHAPVVPTVPVVQVKPSVPVAGVPVAAHSPAHAPVKGVGGGGAAPPRRTADGVGSAEAPRPPKKKRTLEFQLVMAFTVVGAIVLAIAAILLVKVGIDKGVFGPMQRDWASAIAALALVAVGQWWRRREGFWSQGLIGAGIVAMFAAVFAATTMHQFLLPVHGFVFLGITTAGAVAMSLQDWSGGGGAGPGTKEGAKGPARGGMLIATLGLIGGFLTPILVNSGRDDVPGLFGYLVLLHIGLIFATRVRGWTILAAASVVLSSTWLIFWTLFKYHPVPGSHDDGPILGMFMLAMVGSLVLSTITQPEKWRGGKSGLASMTLTWLGVGLGMLSACLLIGKSHYDDFQWAFFAILVAGAFVLARLRPMYEAMAWLASVLVLALLTVWGVGVAGLMSPYMNLGVETGGSIDALQEHLRFQGWLMGFGVATVIGAFACLWKSAVPVRWAVLANGLALAYVGVAYWLLPTPHGVPRAEEWGYLPLAVAVGLAGLMVPLVLQRAKVVTGEESLTVFGHGVLALLLMAAPMGLHGGTWTAAWAAVLPVVALAMWQLKMPGLTPGLLVAAFLVGVRALMLGTVFDAGGPGRSLWWNPVVWSYGTTLLAMALAAWMLEKCPELSDRWRGVIPGPKALAAMMHVGAAVAAFLLLTLEVRWGFHAGKLDAHSALLMERATFAIGWLLLAAAVMWMGKQMQRQVLVVCGEVISVLGLVYAVLGLVIITNPLWWQWQGVDSVGQMPVFNLLVFAYGIPAAVCALLAYVIGKADPERGALATAAGAAGVILLFAMVSLQVRQGYAGSDVALAHTGVSFRESATYSVAWLGLGAACLAIGRRFKKDVLWRAGNVLCTGGAAYAIGVVGIVMSPMLHHVWVGDWKVLNELLFAYGAPAALAVLAAWVADERARKFFGPLPAEGDRLFEGAWSLGHALRAAVMVLLFILVTTEVRQWFQGGYLNDTQITFFERNTYASAWLVLAGLLLAGAHAGRSPLARRGGMTIAVIGLGFVLLVNTLLLNPLWTGERIAGVVVFNDLLYAYGLPAALCAGLVLLLRRKDPESAGFARGVGIVGLMLLTVLVSLEVRQGYAGAQLGLGMHPVTFLELGTYTAMWMSLGAVCLAVGKRWQMGVVQRAGVILTVGGLLYAVGMVGIMGNPILQGQWVGTWRIVNSVLYAYGLPVVLAGVVAWIVDARSARIFGPWLGDNERVLGDWSVGRVMRAGMVVLLFMLVGMEVRQWFQGDHLDQVTMGFMERGSYGVMWFGLAGLLLPVGYGLRIQAARRGGLIVAGMALGWSLLICAVAMNPLWTHESVGAMAIVNGLLYAYGVPALAAAVLGVLLWERRPWMEEAGGGSTERGCAWVAALSSLVLVFVLVTLEVQQFFRGDHLAWGSARSVPGEFVAYSLAWAILGIGYLAAGIWRKSVILRWASLVMMLITIPKVFLVDMPVLHDLQRVLSFAGLGVSLMGLAFVYMRFVFRREMRRQDAEATQVQEEVLP